MHQAKSIGIVGLEGQGAAMARRLAAGGKRVLVWDLSGEQVRELAKDRPRIEIAGSLFDIGADCDVVLTRVATVEELHAVIFGSEERPGFGHTLEPDSIIIDLVPKDPRETRRLVPILGLNGISLVDAAVVGDAAPAPVVLAGGFEPTVARIIPLLGLLGRAERSGEIGAAHALAILAGALDAIESRAAGEMAAIARRLHVDPVRLAAVRSAAHGAPEVEALIALAADLADRTNTMAPVLRAVAAPEPACELANIAVP